MQCHMETLAIKSMEDGVRKMCSFKGEELKTYYQTVMKCALEKGKDNASIKEWEEKKKGNKEEFKKERKEMVAKAMSCKEQVMGL